MEETLYIAFLDGLNEEKLWTSKGKLLLLVLEESN
jgi:hypothetical protein